MAVELKEIDDLSPWELEDLARRAKAYFDPYVGKDAKPFKTHISDERRVCRCFRCGGEARVVGVTITQILCDVCGTFAYQLNHGGAVHVFVSNATHKHGNLVELNLTCPEPEYSEWSTDVDFDSREDVEWLNSILGL